MVFGRTNFEFLVEILLLLFFRHIQRVFDKKLCLDKSCHNTCLFERVRRTKKRFGIQNFEHRSDFAVAHFSISNFLQWSKTHPYNLFLSECHSISNGAKFCFIQNFCNTSSISGSICSLPRLNFFSYQDLQ